MIDDISVPPQGCSIRILHGIEVPVRERERERERRTESVCVREREGDIEKQRYISEVIQWNILIFKRKATQSYCRNIMVLIEHLFFIS